MDNIYVQFTSFNRILETHMQFISFYIFETYMHKFLHISRDICKLQVLTEFYSVDFGCLLQISKLQDSCLKIILSHMK